MSERDRPRINSATDARSLKKRGKRTDEARLVVSETSHNSVGSASQSSLPQTPSRPPPDYSSDQIALSLDTPHSRTSSANTIPPNYTDRIAELRKAVTQELEGHVSVCTPEWLDSELSGYTSTEDIAQFLAKDCSMYDATSRKWTSIDRGARDEKEIYPYIRDVVNAIIKELGGHSSKGKRRRNAIIRDKQRMKHVELKSTSDYTMPDIVIEATGPSFQTPLSFETTAGYARDVGYTNISSVIEVKLKLTSATADMKKLLGQLGVYIRCVFPSVSDILITDAWNILYLVKYSFSSLIVCLFVPSS